MKIEIIQLTPVEIQGPYGATINNIELEFENLEVYTLPDTYNLQN